MTIEYLCDHINHADTVAKWIFDEFIDGIWVDTTYADILSSVKKNHKLELPIRLIALSDTQCVGTVTIKYNDLRCRNYTPWLAALYVDKDFRNKKIGEKLIDRVKTIVTELGFKELYLRTEHASGYYKRLGWEFIESCDDDYNLKPDVFKWTLKPHEVLR